MRKVMLVYCDDPSHTAVPVGLVITEPDPLAFLPDDAYIGREFYQNPIRDSLVRPCLRIAPGRCAAADH